MPHQTSPGWHTTLGGHDQLDSAMIGPMSAKKVALSISPLIHVGVCRTKQQESQINTLQLKTEQQQQEIEKYKGQTDLLQRKVEHQQQESDCRHKHQQSQIYSLMAALSQLGTLGPSTVMVMTNLKKA